MMYQMQLSVCTRIPNNSMNKISLSFCTVIRKSRLQKRENSFLAFTNFISLIILTVLKIL